MRIFVAHAQSLALVTGSLALIPFAAQADQALIERGRYLADAAHCAACHTASDGEDYAGGRPLESELGTLYSTNITPDPETGIGRWDRDDFEAALRQGYRRDGEYLYPAMPYVAFTKITDEDVDALWAYFQSVTPVPNEVAENELDFPYDQRLALAGWQELYFKEGRFEPDSSRSDTFNRGAYLVRALADCGGCHTPRNYAMARQQDERLEGAVNAGWYAPDISGSHYSAIQDWSVDELVTYFQGEHVAENIAAVGPMYETISGGLEDLDERDLRAIAVYLKEQTSPEGGEAREEDWVFTERRREAGSVVYQARCESCHGEDGEGENGVAPTLVDTAAISGEEPHTAIMAVLQGFDPRDQWGAMPSFGYALQNQEIADVVNYIRTAWSNDGAPNATAARVAYLRGFAEIPEDGRRTAAICPNVPASRLDEQTLSAVQGLLDDDAALMEELPSLVSNYRERHPDLSNTDVVVTLAGAYCRDVAQQSDQGFRQVEFRFIRFMGDVASVIADEGEGGNGGGPQNGTTEN